MIHDFEKEEKDVVMFLMFKVGFHPTNVKNLSKIVNLG